MDKTRSEPSIRRHPHPRRVKFLLALSIAVLFPTLSLAQDYNDGPDEEEKPPPELARCNGVYMSYTLESREKEYPHVKNMTAQSWAFNATAKIVNTGIEEIIGWQMFIGFHHRELIVSVDGAVSADGEFPYDASNGTTFIGSPNTDLKTSIETAGDYDKISAKLDIVGTVFGGKANAIPMPKTIKLTNEGWQCPAPKSKGATMSVCCKKNPKFKDEMEDVTKFSRRKHGDLSIEYDILQAYPNNYLAQVTIENGSPLGRLDHWNLTWEWMRGEFISSLRGAYTAEKDPGDCLNSKAGEYYTDMDFSQVANCDKKPIIKDLPPDRKDDKTIGQIPFCCKNGTVLPHIMDPSKAKAVFQLLVYKVPPDLNRTKFYPPNNWNIDGIVNPQYKCGPPVRVHAASFPDPTGLEAKVFAIASWQVVCNITKPKPQAARCCVSFSAFYNDSAIPCNTCACGCKDIDTDVCNANARPMLLPPDTLLVPFANRTIKAKAWAKQRHFPIPKKLPCPDNCGISLNWHLNSDYSNGWTARVTVFNWANTSVEDWFAAVDLGRAGVGFENVYSLNGTRLPPKNQTIFLQGLPGMNYLISLSNGSNPAKDPQVPGKMQSVVLFRKNGIKNLNIPGGDGFPKRVFFNGEECEIPKYLPMSSAHGFFSVGFYRSITLVISIFLTISNRFLFLV